MAGPRGEYRKSAARRAQILDAAQEVFSKNGFSASSVNDIARHVGITQTGVLHHFAGGKTALLMAVLEQRDQQALATLADRTGRDSLAALVTISERQSLQRGVVQLYSHLSAEAVDPEHPAHEYFQRRLNTIAESVTAAYAAVADSGGLAHDVDPREAALQTIAMTEGLERVWLHGFDVDMGQDIRRFISIYLKEPL